MATNIAQFRSDYPQQFFLDSQDLLGLETYLRNRKVLIAGQSVRSADRAGGGNMNCTVRVSAGTHTFIVKQSRPWVERYPQLPAPWDRTCREAEFYQLISTRRGVASMMPRILDFDPEARVLVLEDLGFASDYTGLYRGGSLSLAELKLMAAFLTALHERFATLDPSRRLVNREMRELNHAHIFDLPLRRNNGLDLNSITSGLAEAASSLQSDATYCREVARLGQEVYLADGPCLLHGDFFPGSLLRTPAGPRVIDPEFGFFGRPEFDVAIFLAHLFLSHQPGQQAAEWRAAYHAAPGFQDDLMMKLAGVEIMRRLIGYAQLPIGYGLQVKRELLELSRTLVLQPELHPLAKA